MFCNTPDQLVNFSSFLWNQNNDIFTLLCQTLAPIDEYTNFLPSKGILWTFLEQKYYLYAFCPQDCQSQSPGHTTVADEEWYWRKHVLCIQGDFAEHRVILKSIRFSRICIATTPEHLVVSHMSTFYTAAVSITNNKKGWLEKKFHCCALSEVQTLSNTL